MVFNSSLLKGIVLLLHTQTQTASWYICRTKKWTGACLAFFSLRKSLFCGSGVLAKVWDVEMREFYAGYKLSSFTILWAELRKSSKEIFCSRNLVAPRDFYDARQTFYASSYEILVEKSARRAPGLCGHWAILDNFNRSFTSSSSNYIYTVPVLAGNCICKWSQCVYQRWSLFKSFFIP